MEWCRSSVNVFLPSLRKMLNLEMLDVAKKDPVAPAPASSSPDPEEEE